MRSDKDRSTNAPFLVFVVPVEGKERPFKARALTMAQAASWCPQAAEFGERLRKAMSLNPDARYAVLAEIQELGIETLKACPSIENGDRVPWEDLTFEQVMGAIDEIFEVSDPFARAQRVQMEALEKQTATLSAMKNSGVDIAQFMPSPGDLGSPSPRS
jgi:cytochrome P450